MEPVGIVGAGLMGTGIAAVFAAAGMDVAMYDADRSRLAEAPPALADIAAQLREAGLLDEQGASALTGRVRGVEAIAGLAGRAFVIEAVPEQVAIKHEVYRALEDVLADDAIIASNTSGLMPTVLGEALRRPERFLIAHFWNPAYAIPLVEVVPGPRTSPDALERMVSLLRRVGQQPVVIRKEIPGFIGNRLQYALLREALAIVRAGVATPEEVDLVMRTSLGRRLGSTGPLETADLGGLDTFLGIAEQLMPQLAKDEDVLDLLRERVRAGQIGPRAGQGLYAWPTARANAVRRARDRDLLRQKLADRA